MSITKESEVQPVEIPITNELDLHTFRASEVSALLPEYFAECRKRNILRVRVIHGKGTGALREGVVRQQGGEKEQDFCLPLHSFKRGGVWSPAGVRCRRGTAPRRGVRGW